MKKIRRVWQRYKSDCGVACVAMIAGVSYEQAFEAFCFSEEAKKFYTSRGQLIEALEELGFTMHWKMFRSWEEVPGCAIVPVNHRCNRKNFHWVVYDGKAVFDPNPNRPGRQKSFRRYRASGWYLLLEIDHDR